MHHFFTRNCLMVVLIFLSNAIFRTETKRQKNSCKSFADYLLINFDGHCYYNPEINMDVPSLILRRNYTMETHTLVTQDGHILNMFRLSTYDKFSGQNNSRTPIFLHHGIACSSATFTNIGDTSLAFSLADRGYDVWLANSRGSTYSRDHVNLTVSDKAFWDFSLDKLVEDVSLMLKLVAEVTQKAGRIVYLGHSMGTTVGFMYTASRPEEAQELIQGIVALAPVVYLEQIGIFQIFRIFFENSAAFLGTTPSGTSVGNYLQFIQIFESNKFAMYDYGKKQNSDFYGQSEPPTYDLGRIHLPVQLFAGHEDIFITEKTIKRLYKELGSNDKKLIYIPRGNHPSYNHFDFLYAKDVEEFFYPELFSLLESKYS